MNQYQKQAVYLNTSNGQLSEFNLDPTNLLQENYTEEEINHTLNLI